MNGVIACREILCNVEYLPLWCFYLTPEIPKDIQNQKLNFRPRQICAKFNLKIENCKWNREFQMKKFWSKTVLKELYTQNNGNIEFIRESFLQIQINIIVLS